MAWSSETDHTANPSATHSAQLKRQNGAHGAERTDCFQNYMIFLHQNQVTDGGITIFSSECIWSFTRTNQAFFSSRRALLIQWAVKATFFRFGSSPDWLGWWLLGEWSGHWLVLSWLARQVWTTLTEVAYLLRASWPFGRSAIRIACDPLMSI